MTKAAGRVRPFLRWAGSKKKVLGVLATFWKGRGRYIEPFAGSGALFFHLCPERAIIGDLNAELIEAYRVVRAQPKTVWRLVTSWPSERDAYYRVRSWKPGSLKRIERAARFIYLNRYCFNGLYRTNQRGEFNVPYGGERAGAFLCLEEFERCSEALKSAELIGADFGYTLRKARSGDFVYLDPPYRNPNRVGYGEYGPIGFSERDLRRLQEVLTRLDKKGVDFVVSYADSEWGRELGERFRFQSIEVRRNIAGFSGNRRVAKEVIVTNIA